MPSARMVCNSSMRPVVIGGQRAHRFCGDIDGQLRATLAYYCFFNL